MIKFEIKGKITHFFNTRHHSSWLNQQNSFAKRKIVIEKDGENYTLTFYRERIDLLKFCKEGSIINVKGKLRGRIWKYKNNTYSVNELVCGSLEILKNTIIRDFIWYKGSYHNLQMYILENKLFLNLVNIKNREILKLNNNNHRFPENSVNKTHILMSENIDKNLIETLEVLGVIKIITWTKTISDISGFICKVLVLDLFKNNGFLFSEEEELIKLNQENYSNEVGDILINLPTIENNYERDYFDAMTDGQMGNYDEFIEFGGNIDDLNNITNG